MKMPPLSAAKILKSTLISFFLTLVVSGCAKIPAPTECGSMGCLLKGFQAPMTFFQKSKSSKAKSPEATCVARDARVLTETP